MSSGCKQIAQAINIYFIGYALVILRKLMAGAWGKYTKSGVGRGGKKEFSKRRYYKLKTPFGMRMKVEYKKGQACVALTPKRWYWGWFYLTKTKPAKWHRFPMWIYGLFYITVKGLVGGIDGQA